MNIKTKFQDFRIVSSPADLLAFGRSRNWFFQEMEEKGVLKDEILKSDWVYQPDSNTIPVTSGKKEAYKRLDAVREAGFPIKQVIYGYQKTKQGTEARPAPQAGSKSSPQAQLPDNTGEVLGKVFLGVAGFAVGAAFVMGYAFLMAMSAIDPCLIICLDTGEAEEACPWICLSSWEE